ncbi:hypothetical protein GBZ26_08240 [Azospirillum formosense]|uniref:Uncharacterized protein n=1 Tax=Azospirillum formosense TaxID=861533 RepID=A0ABX2L1X9_9PROT|nr:hypothetical protein [Azospirillum formosense]MBY3756736.1 hypothetical protein [Azospirillum formosense]NUB19200.1 hypothetical protein [Azospirillum formosense]
MISACFAQFAATIFNHELRRWRRKHDAQNRDPMKNTAFKLFGAIATVATVLVVTVGLIYMFPAEVPQWSATFPKEASPDAREIAAAISTPPTHMLRPMRFALYHWQTLIAGVLAFLGGAGAFAAAFVGAQALREQTATNAKLVREQYDLQISKEAREKEEEIAQLARTLHAEIDHIVKLVELGRAHKKLRGIRHMDAGEIKKFLDNTFEDRVVPEVYEAVRGKIGLMPGEAPRKIVQFYKANAYFCTAVIQAKSGGIDIQSSEMANGLRNFLIDCVDDVLSEGRKALELLDQVCNRNQTSEEAPSIPLDRQHEKENSCKDARV